MSETLLSTIPQTVNTVIYSTNVERGASATIMGTVRAPEKIIEINDLKSVSEFFNKTNINSQAVNPVSLIYNNKNSTTKSTSALNQSTHPENKAKAVIDLVKGSKSNPSYTVELKEGDITYATLSKDKEGNVGLSIANQEVFDRKASGNTIEAGVLKAITRQIIIGVEASIENSIESQAAFKQRLSKYIAEKEGSEANKENIPELVSRNIDIAAIAKSLKVMGFSEHRGD